MYYKVQEILSHNLINLSFIEDITPPTLTFINHPLVTNSKVNITWQYDEPATSQCNLYSPSNISTVNCSATSWQEDQLLEGIHTLYIDGMDFEGNHALPEIHTWRVGNIKP